MNLSWIRNPQVSAMLLLGAAILGLVIANTGRPSSQGLMRYATEHKSPLELGTLDPEIEPVLGRFWCTEIARHDRRRLAFAVWSVLSQRLLQGDATAHDVAQPVTP